MPEVYTPGWYDAVVEAMNTRVGGLRGVPEGAWTCRVEIVGDGASPYVGPDDERHFLVRVEGGRCAWYREVRSDEDDTVLDYRFRGPARTFDEIAAGITDPIDAALRGQVKVRGDMRFLVRQAELVKVLLEAYAEGVCTLWPLGAPPYGEGPPRGAAASERGRGGRAFGDGPR